MAPLRAGFVALLLRNSQRAKPSAGLFSEGTLWGTFSLTLPGEPSRHDGLANVGPPNSLDLTYPADPPGGRSAVCLPAGSGYSSGTPSPGDRRLAAGESVRIAWLSAGLFQSGSPRGLSDEPARGPLCGMPSSRDRLSPEVLPGHRLWSRTPCAGALPPERGPSGGWPFRRTSPPPFGDSSGRHPFAPSVAPDSSLAGANRARLPCRQFLGPSGLWNLSSPYLRQGCESEPRGPHAAGAWGALRGLLTAQGPVALREGPQAPDRLPNLRFDPLGHLQCGPVWGLPPRETSAFQQESLLSWRSSPDTGPFWGLLPRGSFREMPSAGPSGCVYSAGAPSPGDRPCLGTLFRGNFSPKTGPVWGFFQKDPAWGLFPRDRSAVRLFSGNPLLVGPAPPSGGGCTDAALIPRGTAHGRGGTRTCSRAHPIQLGGVPGLRLAALRIRFR